MYDIRSLTNKNNNTNKQTPSTTANAAATTTITATPAAAAAADYLCNYETWTSKAGRVDGADAPSSPKRSIGWKSHFELSII